MHSLAYTNPVSPLGNPWVIIFYPLQTEELTKTAKCTYTTDLFPLFKEECYQTSPLYKGVRTNPTKAKEDRQRYEQIMNSGLFGNKTKVSSCWEGWTVRAAPGLLELGA